MVVRKDIEQKQMISFVLHMNGNDKTLEILSDFPESSDFGGNGNIIKEVVKHVRRNNGLRDDETLSVQVKSTHTKKGDGFEKKSATMNKIDLEAKKLNLDNNCYYCKQCNLRYRYKHNFEAHMMNTHEFGNKLSVEESIKKSNDHAAYLERLSIEAKQKLYCKKCNKYFKSRSILMSHDKVIHLGVKEHGCDICGRRFITEAIMKQHRLIHTGELHFICQMCGKGFHSSACLHQHFRSHNSERPYGCLICHSKFKSKHHLKNHITYVHTKEKKFACEICDKRFASSRDMRCHMMSHNGLKPYPCPNCDSKFNQKRYLRQHLLVKHRMESKEACTIVQNITPLETSQISIVDNKNQKHIPVNVAAETSNVLQDVEVSMNETDEVLRVLESVEIHPIDLMNDTV